MDPNAPLPPVPLHLQPATKRPSLDMKKDKERDRLGSGELENMLILIPIVSVHCCSLIT